MRMFSLALALLVVPRGSLAVSLSLPEAKPARPQAEISAVKSPVKLTLSVYKTTIKLQDDFKIEMDYERLDREHPRTKDAHAQDGIDLEKYERSVPVKVGEPLWIKISLKNIGEKPMVIMDDLFTGRQNFRSALWDETRHYGVKVIMTGPDGKDLLPPNPMFIPTTPCPEGAWSKVDPAGTAKAAAWKREGKTKKEIEELLNKEARDEAVRKKESEQAHRPIIKLAAGETITTPPWHKIRCNREYGSFPAQVGDFAELWDYHLDVPGVYKIKAAYFDDPFRMSGGKKIRIETAPIDITVLP